MNVELGTSLSFCLQHRAKKMKITVTTRIKGKSLAINNSWIKYDQPVGDILFSCMNHLYVFMCMQILYTP